MSGKAYDLVYLPDGKTIDASKAAGLDNLAKLQVRIAGNNFFIDLIGETGTKDLRIKRIAQLLEGLNKYAKQFCKVCDDAFEVCAKDPRRYRDSHHQLEDLKKAMDRAADYVYEHAKRILLYLEHLRTTGSNMDDSARVTLQTSMTTQKELIFAARWSVIKEMALDVRPPPGPASLPFGHPEGVPNPEEQDFRPFRDGKPVPVMDVDVATGELAPVDWRYDPAFNVPGSQHCKFFRLPGPYFAPQPDPQDPCDRFILPEVTKRILGYYAAKYHRIKLAFEATGEIPVRTAGEALERTKAIGPILAEMSGEKYDHMSISGWSHHHVNVEKATDPYIYCNPDTMIRQVNFGDGSGGFKPEDLNRCLQVAASGEHHHVKTVDDGICFTFSRGMWQ
ncbi:hypothetical protein VSDG_10005 [Cytospora chrysosperma]|uniref:Uncharacterized protein n=1 Tax=Cytospora chrysosperma TaxID=252740 RepID=A0A423V890_CYTCH|nr:hypothetical protein VSDG_10005 [Valsa sordida]